MGEVLGPPIPEALGCGERLRPDALHRLDVSDRDEHLEQAQLRAVDEDRITTCLVDHETRLEALARRIVLAGEEMAPAEVVEHVPDLRLATQVSPRLDRLLAESLGRGAVSLPRGELRGGGQQARALLAGVGRDDRQCGIDAGPPLDEVRVRVPEPTECAGQARKAADIGSAQPVERLAKVVVVARERIGQRCRAVVALRVRAFGKRLEELGMAIASPIRILALSEPLGGIRANGGKHREALAFSADEAAVDERCQHVEVGAAYGFGRIQPELAREDAQTGEELLLLIVQELVAPGQGGTQRPMPGGLVARAAGQQLEAVAEPVEHRFGREHVDASGSQLDRERQPIQPRADLLDRPPVVVGDREPRQDGRGAGGEERDGILGRHRLDGHELFAGQVHRLAAGEEQPQAGCAGQQVPEVGAADTTCSTLSITSSSRRGAR